MLHTYKTCEIRPRARQVRARDVAGSLCSTFRNENVFRNARASMELYDFAVSLNK